MPGPPNRWILGRRGIDVTSCGGFCLPTAALTTCCNSEPRKMARIAGPFEAVVFLDILAAAPQSHDTAKACGDPKIGRVFPAAQIFLLFHVIQLFNLRSSFVNSWRLELILP